MLENFSEQDISSHKNPNAKKTSSKNDLPIKTFNF